MNLLQMLNRGVDKLLLILEKMTIVILFFMVIMVFINACMRYFLKTNIMVSEELARFCFIWSCFLGSLAIYKRKGHITVTIITDNLKGKAKAVVNAVARIITTAAVIFLCYGATLYIQNTSQYMNAGMRINYGLVMSILPIMSFGMLFLDVIDFVHILCPSQKGPVSFGEGEQK